MNTQPTGLRLPVDLRVKLEKMAEQQHRTISNLIIHILSQHVKEVENEDE